MKENQLSDTIKINLKTIADHFCEEDRAVRERQIRIWRRLKLYWNGFSRLWYDEVAHDWKVWNAEEDENDNSHYDKPVNVFKAYLESIIAALSISIPGIRCAPDDADNPLDISTAKAGNRIAELIAKHNNVSFLWLHALYIYCTEGMIACYNYTKEDKKYGTYEKKEYREDTEEKYVCPSCSAPLSDDLFNLNEFDPGSEELIDENNEELPIEPSSEINCPECGSEVDPNIEKTSLTVTRLIGTTSAPKSRQCMEVYGGLYVKIPNYAMKQEDIPYLIFSYETHYSNVIEMYPHLRDKIERGPGRSSPSNSGIFDTYEQWGRLSTQYYGEYPLNNITVRNCWFRPSSFHVLGTAEEAEEMKNTFPNGCKVVFVNECFAAAEDESLDDHWTLTKNPLSDYLLHDPLGLLLTSIQDITNDLISLTLQTIEQGIPQTFVDPALVNLDEYRQMEALVGGVYPTKPVSSTKNISEGFFSLKTATLSEEVLPFAERVQQLGQLASGALPSLFGGQAESGSKTAAEYSMSRAQAQQRLGTPWKMLTIWWKEIFGKVVPAYIKDMAEDERLVERDKQGNYINVFIRKAEVQGKIGEVELEAAENLPTTWAQIKDVIMKIFEMGNPELLQALFSPENINFVSEAIGLNQFKLPGEDDRQKQYEEIQQLLDSEPISIPPDPVLQQAAQAGDIQAQQMLQEIPTEEPSVPVDQELDNHQIEADICRRFLISEAGRQAKVDNQAGYYNVLLHYKQHNAILQEQMMQAQIQQSPDATGKGEVPPTKIAKTGDANVT